MNVLYFLHLIETLIVRTSNLKPLTKMKNKKNILASIALGIFLLATDAPAISNDKDTLTTGVDKTKVKVPGRTYLK